MNRVKKGSGWEFLLAIRKRAFTWNPASGCSNYNCAVRQRGACWAEKIVKRLGHICPLCPSFVPHIHDGRNGTPNRMDEASKLRKPSVITPVSTGDLFGLNPEQIDRILAEIEFASWHIFATLTKMPQNAHAFNPFPNNVFFGVSVNSQLDTWRLDELKRIKAPVKWAIFEPLYSAIDYDLSWLDWIITGPQTRPSVQPKKEWIESILNNASGVPIFMKSTLGWSSPKLRMGPMIEKEASE